VRYDRTSARVVVDLANGATFAFPPGLVEGPDGASDEQLAAVGMLGAGYGLHWEDLDIHISVPGLMAGIFGTGALYGTPGRTGSLRCQGSRGAGKRRQGRVAAQVGLIPIAHPCGVEASLALARARPSWCSRTMTKMPEPTTMTPPTSISIVGTSAKTV